MTTQNEVKTPEATEYDIAEHELFKAMDKLVKAAKSELQQTKAELEAAKRDVERLNWAIQRPYGFVKVCCQACDGTEEQELIKTREAMDATMTPPSGNERKG